MDPESEKNPTTEDSYDLGQGDIDLEQFLIHQKKVWSETDSLIKDIFSRILPALPPDRRLKVLKELGEGYEDQLYALEQEMANQA